MIKKVWCWLVGHKCVLFAYSKGGMITIHNKETTTICNELYKCTVCGYTDGDDAEGLSWTGELYYVGFSKDVFKYASRKHLQTKKETDETK